MTEVASPIREARAKVDARLLPVGETAYILGFAGLLPQVAALGVTGFGRDSDLGPLFAFGYASLILSFIGGLWWGVAMREPAYQGRTLLAGVIPSLAAAVLILASGAAILPLGWALVLIGSGVMLTLLVDRRMADRGHMPRGWMGLRIVLSLGLGGLTVLTGILA